MKPIHLERLIWLLIYGGILLLCLGLFAQSAAPGLAWGLVIVGASGIAAGIVCIFIRSRMSNETIEP